MLHRDRFATPSGRAVLAAPRQLPPGEEPSPQFPLLLMTGRRLQHYNSGSMTARTPSVRLAGEEHLDVHPDDARAAGAVDGGAAELTSRRGSIPVRVRVSDAMSRGEVFLSFSSAEVLANLLTSDAVDQVTSCPEFKVSAVRLGPARPHGSR